jgi:hypothetical protein
MAELPRHWVIDRIEGEWAVIDRPDGTSFDLPRWMLPDGCREGDVLRVAVGRDGAAATWRIERDEAETARRLEKARRELEELRRRDPGGDIKL